MKPVFADTSFYGALFNPQDTWHDAARELSGTLHCPVVVTEFVLLELGNALAPPNSRRFFGRLLQHLRADQSVVIVPASEMLFEKGFTLYDRRGDKGWSLTDCISFIVMDQYGLAEALTSDHHFEQAGFTILLK